MIILGLYSLHLFKQFCVLFLGGHKTFKLLNKMPQQSLLSDQPTNHYNITIDALNGTPIFIYFFSQHDD